MLEWHILVAAQALALAAVIGGIVFAYRRFTRRKND